MRYRMYAIDTVSNASYHIMAEGLCAQCVKEASLLRIARPSDMLTVGLGCVSYAGPWVRTRKSSEMQLG
jgi:hypothetical protein